jgi:hypothetical protein
MVFKKYWMDFMNTRVYIDITTGSRLFPDYYHH